MRFEAIFYSLGRLLCMIGLLMLIPALVSLIYGEHAIIKHFGMAFLFTVLLGAFLMMRCNAAKDQSIGIRDGFLLVTLSWLSLSFLGAIPCL